MTCFGVNVSGPGIPPSGSTLPACNTAALPPPALWNGLVPIGQGKIDLYVPSGSARLIQLLAMQTAYACPAIGNYASGSAIPPDASSIYEVGRTIADVSEDVIVTINATFSAANSPSWLCPTVTISSIAAQSGSEDTLIASIPFTIGGGTVPATSLTATAASSNTSLVDTTGISFSGTGASRTVTLNPKKDAFGSAVITLTVTDGVSSTSSSFTASFASDGRTQADFVIGQPDRFTTSAATTSSKVSAAVGVATDGANFYVSEFSNHRILQFSGVPSADSPTANSVMGQASFILNAPGAANTTGIDQPQELAISATGKFFAVDMNHHRVLMWNALPTATNTPADIVIGQTAFTGGTPGLSGNRLNTPHGVAVAGTQLFISDMINNRALIFNTIPGVNGASASFAVGQNSLIAGSVNAGAAISAIGLAQPRGIASDGTKLVIIDTGNHRALLYNTIPGANGIAANIVLGQPVMTTGIANNGGRSGSTLNNPISAVFSGTRLYIADGDNNRILYWNSWPAVNGQAADGVIGQPDMVTGNPGNTSDSMSLPSQMVVEGGKLFVADYQNNRVLAFTEP